MVRVSGNAFLHYGYWWAYKHIYVCRYVHIGQVKSRTCQLLVHKVQVQIFGGIKCRYTDWVLNPGPYSWLGFSIGRKCHSSRSSLAPWMIASVSSFKIQVYYIKETAELPLHFVILLIPLKLFLLSQSQHLVPMSKMAWFWISIHKLKQPSPILNCWNKAKLGIFDGVSEWFYLEMENSTAGQNQFANLFLNW